MDKDKMVGNTREPQCSICRGPTTIYYSQGADVDGHPFVTPKTYPCSYCSETQWLKGWADCARQLVDVRKSQ